MDALSQIARTVLYEGYVLWPYRRSAMKNQQRWTFGGIYPSAFAAESGGVDRSTVRADVLIEAASGTEVRVAVRFLHVVARQVMRLDGDRLVPVSELEVGADRYLSWDEATEREIVTSLTLRDEGGSIAVPIVIDDGEVSESVLGPDGETAGAIVRSWRRIDGRLTVESAAVHSASGCDLHRVVATVTNSAAWRGAERSDAVRHTLASAHVVLRTDGGSFVSAVDPGATLEQEAHGCRNEGLWPVLVGAQGARDTMLASPIILYDYPRIAPESPGDLFDGGEIDQLLILNILTLTDEEQREMRDSDPRAREILDRCRGLSDAELARLHGTVRSMQSLVNAEESGERHLG